VDDSSSLADWVGLLQLVERLCERLWLRVATVGDWVAKEREREALLSSEGDLLSDGSSEKLLDRVVVPVTVGLKTSNFRIRLLVWSAKYSASSREL
jgi:hypothetical protein